jgi:hypothetical protein
VDVFRSLFRAAVEQPRPSPELVVAIEKARSMAMGVGQAPIRERVAESVGSGARAERLAESLLRIYEDEE